jgi:hypothetical protein
MGLSQVYKVDNPFQLWVSLTETHKLLTHHVRVHCHSEEFSFHARVRVSSSEQISLTLSALQNNT